MLGAAAAGVGCWLMGARAEASVVRGLSLEELSRTSDRILVGRALDGFSHWEKVGGRKRIVTDTRVRVEDVLAKGEPSDAEILVRTLGGSVGDLSALVHGEALLRNDERCVLFLSEREQVHRVIGMAQGHYPVLPDVERIERLYRSPRNLELRGGQNLAAQRLIGQKVSAARVLIQEALKR